LSWKDGADKAKASATWQTHSWIYIDVKLVLQPETPCEKALVPGNKKIMKFGNFHE
jgi:hypothetical protein